jgi:hypothetical protein
LQKYCRYGFTPEPGVLKTVLRLDDPSNYDVYPSTFKIKTGGIAGEAYGDE